MRKLPIQSYSSIDLRSTLANNVLQGNPTTFEIFSASDKTKFLVEVTGIQLDRCNVTGATGFIITATDRSYWKPVHYVKIDFLHNTMEINTKPFGW